MSPFPDRDPQSGGEPVFVIDRRRIYILPTRQGLVFAFVLLLMLAGSMNYENNLGYFMTFQLGAVGLLSMLFAFRDLHGLRVSLLPATPVFAGETAWFTVQVDNRGGRQRHGVLIRLDPRPAGAPGLRSPSPDPVVVRAPLAAGGEHRAQLGLITQRRGWQTLDGVLLASRHPFGLFRAWAPIRLRARSLVYPAARGEQPLPAPYAEERTGPRARSGSEEDFAGLRAFQRGDTPKHVHWKAAARHESLPVKVFSGGQGGLLWLRYDEVIADEPETRLSQLCRWVLEAERSGLRYALELPDRVVGDQHTANLRSRCLAALALHGLNAAVATSSTKSRSRAEPGTARAPTTDGTDGAAEAS